MITELKDMEAQEQESLPYFFKIINLFELFFKIIVVC